MISISAILNSVKVIISPHIFLCEGIRQDDWISKNAQEFKYLQRTKKSPCLVARRFLVQILFNKMTNVI
tara:strand:+ start:9026 stop:9232 length:207 start_codon:yes stop_codon:yes gene_type:complete